MQEGILSLMQLAKSRRGRRAARERLPFLSILTDPSTAGVMASFASLGDVILAEPGRSSASPAARHPGHHPRGAAPGFQRADFVLEHGFVDVVAHRKENAGHVGALGGLLLPGHERIHVGGAGRGLRPEVAGARRLAPRAVTASPATYQTAIERLFGLERGGGKLGLEGARRLLGALGDPQRRFASLHVAGTNGKGSTACYLERLLREAGVATGFFTSPTWWTPRAHPVAGRAAAARRSRRRGPPGALRSRGPHFFEAATAIGFDHFARHASPSRWSRSASAGGSTPPT